MYRSHFGSRPHLWGTGHWLALPGCGFGHVTAAFLAQSYLRERECRGLGSDGEGGVPMLKVASVEEASELAKEGSRCSIEHRRSGQCQVDLEWGYAKYFCAAESLEDYTPFEKEWVRREVARFYVLEEETERYDREVVKESVEQDVEALAYYSKELEADREFVKQYDIEYRYDRIVVVDAVEQNGCDKEYRYDREVVMEAVEQDVGLFRYYSKELEADEEIVKEAFNRSGHALKDVSEEQWADKRGHNRGCQAEWLCD